MNRRIIWVQDRTKALLKTKSKVKKISAVFLTMADTTSFSFSEINSQMTGKLANPKTSSYSEQSEHFSIKTKS